MSSSSARSAGSAAAEVQHPAEDHQVLPAGEIVVHRGVLTGQTDDRRTCGVVDHVVPGTLARPSSGVASVDSTLTAVVLPAPFGPSRAQTVPAVDGDVDAVEGSDLDRRP